MIYDLNFLQQISTFCNKFLIDIWWSEVSPPTLPMRQIFSFWKKRVNHYTIRRWCHKNVSMRSQQSALIQSFYCKEINFENVNIRTWIESYFCFIIFTSNDILRKYIFANPIHSIIIIEYYRIVDDLIQVPRSSFDSNVTKQQIFVKAK